MTKPAVQKWRFWLRARRAPKLDEPDPDTNLVMIRWRSAFECGHPVIDRQHRELFNIGNELINSVLGRRPKHDIELLLRELVEHIKEHFATEEDVLSRTRYPLSDEHRNIHGNLLERARDLEERYRTGQLAVSDLVGFISYDVISAHIVNEDLKFALQDR